MSLSNNSLITPAMSPLQAQPKDSSKESKTVGGQSSLIKNPTISLHGAPIQKVNIPNLKLGNFLLSTDKILEPSDTNTAGETLMSTFRSQTGFLDDEPVIVMMSEFIPIYQGSNQIYKSLNVKEKSRLVTARNACIVLDQDDAVKNYLQKYKESFSKFVKENQFSIILVNMSTLYELLKVQNFVSGGGRSFISLLDRYGEDVKNYLPTKVWQQSLVDIKSSFKSYTVKLVAGNFPDIPPQVSKNEHLLSGINTVADTKIWFNVNAADRIGNIADLYPKSFEDQTIVDKLLEKSISKITTAYNKLYVDTSKIYGDGRNPSANSLVDSFSGTGRDIALLSTILSKEATYSGLMLDKADILKKDYGYDVETASGQSVFDFLIGKFTNSVLEVPLSPTGNGKSLANFSYGINANFQNQNNFILTFENSYFTNSKLVPGTYYYVESSLQSNDGKKFDVSRLNEFTQKVSYANDSLLLLLQMISPSQSAFLIENSSNQTKESRISTLKNLNGDKKYARNDTTSSSYTLGKYSTSYRSPFSSIFSTNSQDPQSLLSKSSSSVLINGIMNSMKNLQNLYLEMLTSNNYQPDRGVVSERIAASLLKLCVAYDNSSTSFDKEKIDRIRSIIFLYVMTGLMVENPNIGSIKESLLTKLYLEFSIKDTSPLPSSTIAPNPISVTDISATNVMHILTSIVSSLPKEKIYNAAGLTAYSQADPVFYWMANFDLILRIVAAMTPDNFINARYLQPDQVVVF